MLEPELTLTVPRVLWDEVADKIGRDADGYLCKAKAEHGVFTPHTLYRYDRLMRDKPAREAIRGAGYIIAKPLPFGHPLRQDYEPPKAGVEKPPPPLPKWRPLSDAEYEALTLRDKARHQRILAGHVFNEAWRVYKRVGSRDIAKLRQDAEWREMEQRETAHLAEAARLEGYLRDPPEAN